MERFFLHAVKMNRAKAHAMNTLLLGFCIGDFGFWRITDGGG
jgi:hypothetical protein